jgi:8-oxo-dGTP pyrophosphatase MutT (NUDIX family)
MVKRATRMRFESTETVGSVSNTKLSRVVAVNATGRRVEGGLVSRPPVVAVLGVDYEREQVALAHQGRFGALGALVLETSGGKIDRGEISVLAARRELEEELGLAAGHLELVASELWIAPDHSDAIVDLVIASELTEVEPREKDDHIELVWIPFAGLEEALATQVRDLRTFALLQAFMRLRGIGR